MNQHQKNIYDTLQKAGLIRSSRLKDIVVKEKKLMSDRPFRIHLAELVDSDKVIRFESGKQNVHYCTKQNYIFLLNTLNKAEKAFKNSEKDFELLKSKFAKMSEDEIVKETVVGVMQLGQFDSMLDEAYKITKEKKFKDALDNMLRMKSKLLNLTNSDKAKKILKYD